MAKKKAVQTKIAKEPQPRAAVPYRPSALVDTRVIYCGDNLEQLQKLPDGCIDLIYIDPPFNSNRNYEVFWGETKEKRAFEDRHASTQAYIEFMRPRCEQLHRVLKETGSFYFHCDWHASHYVKVMLDQIFGQNSFQNEIIWRRQSAHSDAKTRFPAVTESIFFYGSGAGFHPQYSDHDPEYLLKFYRFNDNDDRGPYRLGDMASPNPRPNMMYEWLGFTWPEKGWRYQRETMQALHDEGRIYYPKKADGSYDISKRPALKRYLREQKGSIVTNLWDDIEPVQAQSAERLGYPTQKPLALLERIIEASSNENDIVLDAFCGCGTALVAAENLGRQWIGIDLSPTACRVMAKRLRDVCSIKEDEKLWKIGRGFVVRDLPWTEKKLREIPPFEFENWAVIALGGNRMSHRWGIWGSTAGFTRSRQRRKRRPESLGLWTCGTPFR
jgi:site-specific DNA-methyltransferase (adenine-specific)